MNEVSVYLTLWTSLNKLATIRLHGQLEIVSPHDLIVQHIPSHMWSADSRMNLSLYSIGRGAV